MSDTARLAALLREEVEKYDGLDDDVFADITCGDLREWLDLAGVTLDPRPAPDAALREAGWALYHNIVDEDGRKYVANDEVLAKFRAALEPR